MMVIHRLLLTLALCQHPRCQNRAIARIRDERGFMRVYCAVHACHALVAYLSGKDMDRWAAKCEKETADVS